MIFDEGVCVALSQLWATEDILAATPCLWEKYSFVSTSIRMVYHVRSRRPVLPCLLSSTNDTSAATPRLWEKYGFVSIILIRMIYDIR